MKPKYKLIQDDKPHHIHDCKTCTYCFTLQHDADIVDVYICQSRQNTSTGSILYRHSSEPSDFGSVPLQYRNFADYLFTSDLRSGLFMDVLYYLQHWNFIRMDISLNVEKFNILSI